MGRKRLQNNLGNDRMTQLKTLKDLIEKPASKDYSTTDTIFKIQSQFADELRQEAIKWINDLRSTIIRFEKSLGDENTEISLDMIKGVKAKIEWIKHFFNITDGELRD